VNYVGLYNVGGTIAGTAGGGGVFLFYNVLFVSSLFAVGVRAPSDTYIFFIVLPSSLFRLQRLALGPTGSLSVV
jgi:hypothetical protein